MWCCTTERTVVRHEPGRECRVVLGKGFMGDGGGRHHDQGAVQSKPEGQDGAVGFGEGSKPAVWVVAERSDDVQQVTEEEASDGARRRRKRSPGASPPLLASMEDTNGGQRCYDTSKQPPEPNPVHVLCLSLRVCVCERGSWLLS